MLEKNEKEKLLNSAKFKCPTCCKIRKCPMLVEKSKVKTKDYLP